MTSGREDTARENEATESKACGSDGITEATEFEACGRVFSSADIAGSMDFIAGNLDEYLAAFNSILELLKDYFKDRIESPTSSDTASEAISSTSSPSGKELIIDKSLIPDSVREKLVSASEALSIYDLDTAQSELEAALLLTASNNSNNNDPASSDRQLTTILSSVIGKSLDRINSFDYDGAANILNELI